jgi:DNA-binding transcriptional LysR family regulator
VDWNDLKFLVAVVDTGSLKGAAQTLDVETHEVGTRITALESSLNCELVARTSDGIAITPAGHRAADVAREIKKQLASLATEVGGEMRGTICVTTAAGFVPKALEAIGRLREKYPALDIELMVSMQPVDLMRKEADLAVRMFKDDKPGQAMQKLGTMGWSLYASESYLAGRAKGDKLLDGHQVIAYDKNFANTQGGRWIAANAPAESISMHVGGIRQALDAAQGGHGVCVVPCYLTAEHKLVRVTDQVVASNDVYAVYLAERADEPRMKVVVDALLDLFKREQTTFAGTV